MNRRRSELSKAAGPVIPPTTSLPEITLKAVLLSVVLAAVLAAANAYLGLFAGMTVSASIPAAVMSMAILRVFRRSNILENNIVQTAASSGEALAAGVIFTLPGLLLLGYWQSFEYWPTLLISLVGGLLGVIFTIPLRRALILDAKLQFPEGVATAEVLKVGAAQQSGVAGSVGTLVAGALLSGAVKFGESGLRLWDEAAEGTVQMRQALLYGGLNLSPALLAVGFIIGLNTALVVCAGGALSWMFLLPLYGLVWGMPEGPTGVTAAKAIWSSHLRYVGIGAMLVGGLWTLVQIRRPVWASLRQLASSYRVARFNIGAAVGQTLLPRTERDASWPWIVGPFLVVLVPMTWLYWTVVDSPLVGLGMVLVMAVAAFIFSSVAAYMAGLVGSSSNPVSGVTIATLMLASLLLVFTLGVAHPLGPAAALMISAVVCCAAAMGGDNLQDLKTGHLVGATPWKQQVMQVVGVATGAVVLAPVLSLLQAKYGIGPATTDHLHALAAPQATLMASVAQGVFGGGVPWEWVTLGAAFGIAVILFDQHLLKQGAQFRVPVLALALGMYLPLKLSSTILGGGLIAHWASRQPGIKNGSDGNRWGLLFAAGLVTGESLMGIFLAIPVALSTVWPRLGGDPLALYDAAPFGAWPGAVAVGLVAWLLYRAARRDDGKGREARGPVGSEF
jgi:putative OPT family oligopeptide transporter